MTIPTRMAPRVRVSAGNWNDTFPPGELAKLVYEMGRQLDNEVRRGYESGEYLSDSFGMVILDPAAPNWRPSTDCILATIAVGNNGDGLLVNALAKVVIHRDHGQEAGIAVYTMKRTIPDRYFKWGFSALLDGTFAGGSGQKELQDRMLVTRFVADFNCALDSARKQSEADHPKNSWYANDNCPAAELTYALTRLAGDNSLTTLS
ncbi:hypothetical protein HJC99_00710 [Candidatus Saccharibacteria bacterium]|nr:hypothetical protein [Candidatus Saccharibacteria bacterium]